MVREPFLSLSEPGCSPQSRGFNYDSTDYHNALLSCSFAGWEAHGPRCGMAFTPDSY